ncbi:MAG: hypothetical protein NZ873_02815 [Crenarchaeota archaeon]|nr:hypothetical protein [Thermoproteota archaeon]MDW8034589.1 hypothetical protein [Nitrososphaerota archaeon]
MVRRIVPFLALALLSIFLSTSLKSYASPFELSHDDGSANALLG